MKIKKEILLLIQTSGNMRMRIAIALGVSESTVRRYVAENSSDLTKAAAIQVIKDMTGIRDDKKILESIPDEKIK
jgi:predicted transcriptional regulator